MNEFTDYSPQNPRPIVPLAGVDAFNTAFVRMPTAAPAGLRPMSDRVGNPPAASAPPSSIDLVLAERGKRYGIFAGHAVIAQSLKSVVASELGKRGKFLAHDQQEAMDMICHKMARVVNGDADHIDSWVDIAGYAQLVVDRLTKDSRGARA